MRQQDSSAHSNSLDAATVPIDKGAPFILMYHIQQNIHFTDLLPISSTHQYRFPANLVIAAHKLAHAVNGVAPNPLQFGIQTISGDSSGVRADIRSQACSSNGISMSYLTDATKTRT